MKAKNLFFLFLILIFNFSHILAQNVEERNIEEFDRIDASGYFDIYLSKGDKPSLKVESKHLRLDEIITRVSGNTLHLNRAHYAGLIPKIPPVGFMPAKVYNLNDDLGK